MPKGTKRFEPGDALIAFLDCMREGKPFPSSEVWSAWEKTWASDNRGVLDPRYRREDFRLGYGMVLYWETLAKWINARARRDARRLGVPLVSLQAVDECNASQGDPDGGRRLLNAPNMHKTGDIHGVLPARVGMGVRFTVAQEKLKKKLGIAREQRATVAPFEFHPEGEQRRGECSPSQLFRPRFLPQGIWPQVRAFKGPPIYQEVAELLRRGAEGADDDGQAEARSLLMFKPSEQELTRQSSGPRAARRSRFTLAHAPYLASALSQGQTLRKGVTVECARGEDAGRAGMSDDQWWLHLHVMFSRATRARNVLILRPPPREFLERRPLASLRNALLEFDKRAESSWAEAEHLAAELGFALPPA